MHEARAQARAAASFVPRRRFSELPNTETLMMSQMNGFCLSGSNHCSVPVRDVSYTNNGDVVSNHVYSRVLSDCLGAFTKFVLVLFTKFIFSSPDR